MFRLKVISSSDFLRPSARLGNGVRPLGGHPSIPQDERKDESSVGGLRLHQQGPRNRLRRAAGAAPPRGASFDTSGRTERRAGRGGLRLHQQGPRNRLRRAAGAAPPSGGILRYLRTNGKTSRAWGCVFTSRGRGTGFAGPQAQRPPRGASFDTSGRTEKRAGRGAASSPAGATEPASPGRRRSGPLGGASFDTSGRTERRAGRGGCVFTSRGHGTGFAGPQAQRPPRGAGSYAKRTTVGAISLA